MTVLALAGLDMFPLHYWQYFLTIESDLEVTARYVDFGIGNDATYSVEFARILLSAGSEIDVVAKLLCHKAEPGSTPQNMTGYRTILYRAYPRLHELDVTIPRFGVRFRPWKNWSAGQNPDWWTAYNAVKHERNQNFLRANQLNALHAVGGLFYLVLYYYADELRSGLVLPWARLLGVDSGLLPPQEPWRGPTLPDATF